MGLFLLGSALNAFGNDQAGTSGAVFLKIGPGARPVGMGEAFTGVADDVHAVYWNPAGLASLTAPELTGMHMQYFQDISYEFAAFAYPTRQQGTWAFAVSNLHTDGIERRLEDTDAAVGEFSANDSAYWLSYGRRLNSRLSAGGSFKVIRQTLDEADAQAFAFDGGALYETDWNGLRLGASLQNAGTRVKFLNESDPLPLTARLGASLPVLRRQLRLAADVILPCDHDAGLAVGGEYRRRVGRTMTASLRSGYRTDRDVDGLKGIAVGAGLGFGRLGMDFAWVPFGDLGNTYRYALHLRFGAPDEAEEEAGLKMRKAEAVPSYADTPLRF